MMAMSPTKGVNVTAHQIALLWDLALNAHDRGELGIEGLSSTVRSLKSLAEETGLEAEVKKARTEIRLANYEAPARG